MRTGFPVVPDRGRASTPADDHIFAARHVAESPRKDCGRRVVAHGSRVAGFVEALFSPKGVRMTLAEEVAQGVPPRARPRGKIAVWLDELDVEDRAAAEAVLSDAEWQHERIAELFARHGLIVSSVQVGKYRRANRAVAG